jgi:hypothetical protein
MCTFSLEDKVLITFGKILLVCWVKNINTEKKNTEALLQASGEGGVKVNLKKIKYMFMFLHQNAGQSHDLLIANKYF